MREECLDVGRCGMVGACGILVAESSVWGQVEIVMVSLGLCKQGL